jgi:hypothetical protein
MSQTNRVSGNGSFLGNGYFGIIRPIITGGTLTSDSTYYYRTFLNNGTLTVSNANLNADILMIAGGGGARSAYYPSCSGGGGAGGLKFLTNQTLTSNQYSILIGGGGGDSGIHAYFGSVRPSNGNDTSIIGIDSVIGGGRGANDVSINGNFNSYEPGGDGGSGGGNLSSNNSPYRGTQPGLGINGQGHNGGFGVGIYEGGLTGGAGGGAGSAGTLSVGTYVNGIADPPSYPGNGLYFDDFGLATNTGEFINNHYYFGGGGVGNVWNYQGGGRHALSVDGNGGGGRFGQLNGISNTGGGAAPDGNGGSGLVIIRYTKQSVGG